MLTTLRRRIEKLEQVRSAFRRDLFSKISRKALEHLSDADLDALEQLKRSGGSALSAANTAQYAALDRYSQAVEEECRHVGFRSLKHFIKARRSSIKSPPAFAIR